MTTHREPTTSPVDRTKKPETIRVVSGEAVVISRRWLLVVAIFLFLVTSVSLVGSWRTSIELREYVQCQADWNSFLSRALDARSGASVQAQAAMDQLVNAVSEAKSGEEVRAALANYNAARANQIRTLNENPIPKPPDEICTI